VLPLLLLLLMLLLLRPLSPSTHQYLAVAGTLLLPKWR